MEIGIGFQMRNDWWDSTDWEVKRLKIERMGLKIKKMGLKIK